MEHPLIGSLDHLNEQELLDKITDLNRKLSIAARTGNGHLCDQIRMALESFQSRYQAVIKENLAKAGSSNFNDKISIK
jgi:hypothetical protein